MRIIHRMILQLCKSPKTHTEVRNIINFDLGADISGISMAAYLSGLRRDYLVEIVGRKGRYSVYKTTKRGIRAAGKG